MGLGFAATRDVVSFLRNETTDAADTANPVAGRIDRAIGFGISQSGRYLQDYLYLGFNTDEAGRTVFEGLTAAYLRRQKDFYELPLQPARPLALSACRHAVSRRGLSLHLSGHHGCPDRQARRLSGALPRRQQLPEDHQDRQRTRILPAARLIGGDGHARQRARDAGQCQAVPDLEPATFCDWPSPSPRWSRPAPSRPIRSMPVRRRGRLLVALDGWISNGTLPPPSRYPSLQGRHADHRPRPKRRAIPPFPASPTPAGWRDRR